MSCPGLTDHEWNELTEVELVAKAERDTEPSPPPEPSSPEWIAPSSLEPAPICLICDGIAGAHDPACPANEAVEP